MERKATLLFLPPTKREERNEEEDRINFLRKTGRAGAPWDLISTYPSVFLHISAEGIKGGSDGVDPTPACFSFLFKIQRGGKKTWREKGGQISSYHSPSHIP